MPIIAVEVGPESPHEVVACGPDLTFEDLEAELEDWAEGDPPLQVGAREPLADRPILAAAAALHRGPVPVVLRVRAEAVRRRVEQALPGSGGRRLLALPGGARLVLAEGDIIAMPVDAIVNASNRMLRLGAGVSGAIARAAQPSLQAELTARAGADGIPPGEGIQTGPHGIPGLTGLIHVNAVSGSAAVVASAATRALALAEEAGFRSLALPLLGTGTGGLSVDAGLAALAEALEVWAARRSGALDEVWVVVWSDAVFARAGVAFRRHEPTA